jgi:hypothetical protein
LVIRLDLEIGSASVLYSRAKTLLPEDIEAIRRDIEVIRNLVEPITQGL